MIRSAVLDDLPALRELFARGNDSPYDLAAVAEEKCFGDGIAGAPVVRVWEHDSRIIGAAVSCGKWLRVLAVDRKVRRRGIGSALLHDAESRGVSVVFAEPGNYLMPGVPADDVGTRAFFRTHGFVETQSTWNLEVDIDGIRGEAVRPTHADADRVLSFVEREFGPIWRFEAAKAFERDVPPAFIAEEGGEIVGFAVHDVNNRGLGFFGPTGVAKSMRGKGVGCRLLLASLADLRRLGYARAVIPWTDALEFYRKCCGATPANQFVAMQKP
ncbi:MAG: GNAT family N-acetyltransferase [Acidobacteriota bacterium]|nr:GNAT family N-acetyltransferase [Acidobacteriota bacterium]